MHTPSESVFFRTIRGSLIDAEGEPIVGAIIRENERHTTTDINGIYELELSTTPAKLEVEFPLISGSCPASFTLTGVLRARGRCNRQSFSGSLSGRVVSSGDGQPLPDVKVISDNGLFIDTSDAEGKFRGLCSPETKSLRLTPAFLSRSEQALFNKLIPRLELPPATENQPAHEIGDIAVPMSTGDIAMRVRILMPDGAPAENATVELWTRLKKSSRPCQNQLVDACGEKLYGTVTDSNGDCTLTPSIRFDEPQYAVVAFPRIAPRFFG
ncbi:MAG: carboxypeptidase-like regulatory domain-containing protein, partial [Fuerstiella sp.]